jgi:hypothetical protein
MLEISWLMVRPPGHAQQDVLPRSSSHIITLHQAALSIATAQLLQYKTKHP